MGVVCAVRFHYLSANDLLMTREWAMNICTFYEKTADPVRSAVGEESVTSRVAELTC